jgi:hypothetical protein
VKIIKRRQGGQKNTLALKLNKRAAVIETTSENVAEIILTAVNTVMPKSSGWDIAETR